MSENKTRYQKAIAQMRKDCEAILNYFSKDPKLMNQMTIDAISMRIIDIGSKIADLEFMGISLPPGIDWKSAKRMRDKIAHHYEGFDPERIESTCKNDIPELLRALKKASV